MTAGTDQLQEALRRHRAGRFDDARTIYGEILRVDPAHADAWHLTGLCAFQAGDVASALPALRRAVALNGKSAVYHTSLGTALESCGETAEAREHFQRAIELHPSSAEAHFNFANLLRKRRDFESAAAHYRVALQHRPDNPDILNNLATTLKELGAVDEAESHYRDALRHDAEHIGVLLNLATLLGERNRFAESFELCATARRLAPDNAEAHHLHGRLLQQTGDLSSAVSAYEHSLRLNPAATEAASNLATCLQALGRLSEAEALLKDLLSSAPESAAAWNNLGSVHNDQDRPDDAAGCFERALKIRPDFTAAWNNLGNALKSVRRFDDAADCYARAAGIDPGFVEAHSNRAGVLQSQGRTAEARRHLQRANTIRPSDVRRFEIETLLPVIPESAVHIADCRERLTAGIAKLRAEGVRIDAATQIAPTLFYAAYHGRNDRELMRDAAMLFESSFDPRPFQESNETRIDSRVRIGFLSSYLKKHTIGRLMRGLIGRIDRERFHVTVLSPSVRHDRLDPGVQQAADDVVELTRRLPIALQRAASARLDVLAYPDVGMDPFTTTLARSRLAKRQCVMWGHPVTTGMPSIDDFLSSELLELDEAEGHYTERLVRLKTLPCFYERPETPSNVARSEFGLPYDRPIYLCPQSLFKLHPDFDANLSEILTEDRRGLLVLIDPPHDHWKELLRRRWWPVFGDRLDRVQFLPRMSRDRFLRLIATADVMLDPVHFGGGNTNYEALSLGAPVVTLPSRFLRGRVALGLYRRMGVADCVVETDEQYVERSVQIANDRDFRVAVKDRIQSTCDVLFHDDSAVRELEAFWLQAAG